LLSAFFSSLFIIAVAELGDKTQLLAFGFAAKYPLWEVISAVACATGLLMFMAVIFGGIINYYIPAFFIQLLVGVLFIAFGIWNLYGEKEEEAGKSVGNPFWIVFVAFFLAELGDKTQIATLAISARYGAPFQVWLGATLGMVIVNCIGAFAGKWIGKHIPVMWLKVLASLIFFVFGLVTLGALFIW
jgi:putative Ca2+/H+ antiporter (TMEM165/GDT1 family)